MKRISLVDTQEAVVDESQYLKTLYVSDRGIADLKHYATMLLTSEATKKFL